jgi:hypothetical protein
LINEDYNLALETMRHIYLENLSYKKYQYNMGKKNSNYQPASNRYYSRTGKSTVSTNFRELDDGIPD